METRSVPSRSASRLSYSSCGSSGATGPRMGSSFLPDLDGSEPEENLCQQFLMYQCHGGASSHTSEESLSAAPQVWDSLITLHNITALLKKICPTVFLFKAFEILVFSVCKTVKTYTDLKIQDFFQSFLRY